jgi:hypothetical protein
VSTIGEKLKHEVRELIPVTVFFFVGTQLLALTQMLILDEYRLHAPSFAGAAIGSLIIAKVVLIADHLPFVNRFPGRPIIYNVLWKTGIYYIGAILFRYVEHLIHFWRKAGSFMAANRQLVDEVVWPHVFVIQLWVLVLLLIYCTMRELTAAQGHDRMHQLFLIKSRPAHSDSIRG